MKKPPLRRQNEQNRGERGVSTNKDKPRFRVGIGYDVHRWSAARNLVLGGVRIPHGVGLAGHSDADVLTHAIIDALLGSVALGDIGRHFPDSDEQYRNVRSLNLLEQVMEMVKEKGYAPCQVDAVIVAEEPRLSPHIPAIRECLAQALRLPPDYVSVKATTTEGLLYAGPKGGIACYSVVQVTRTRQPRESETKQANK